MKSEDRYEAWLDSRIIDSTLHDRISENRRYNCGGVSNSELHTENLDIAREYSSLHV